MSNVIRLLESLGREIGAGAVDSAEFASRMETLDLAPALRAALIGGDVAALSAALGGRTTMMMVLAPAEPDGEQPQEDEKPDSEVRAAA